ncbi:MAG: DUF4382 domain-containing protein [Gemmatimonadetes bacterium]|nr:DUF4382 domain-containing protein [Gemmatimonadota bacterium]
MARSNRNRVMRWCVAAAVLPLAAGACDTNSTSPATGQTAVSLYVKDAPGDVQGVWVLINDVVLMSDGGNTSLLQDPPVLVKLTDYQTEPMALGTTLNIDPGVYHQLRFMLGGAVVWTTGDEVYSMGDLSPDDIAELTGKEITGPLQCPSCTQSGLKVNFPGDITVDQGTATGILMDFDVPQSFAHQAGQSGKWVMRPVIHGSVAPPAQIESGTVGGTITGTVELAKDGNGDPIPIPDCDDHTGSLTEFVPMATATTLQDGEGNFLMFSGQTDEAGAFAIGGLDLDAYTLGYQAETTFTTLKLVWTAAAVPPTATIDAGNPTVSGVTYTVSATCEDITP